MPRSCKCILDRAVFKGAMSEEDRDKILRNIKGIEWHPYPQEKPKDLNDKLVTIRESDGNRYTTIGFFDEGQWRGKNEFWIPNNRVTAWAELPKPYTGDDRG